MTDFDFRHVTLPYIGETLFRGRTFRGHFGSLGDTLYALS